MAVITNTHLLVPEFDLIEPETSAQAVATLAALGAEARILAGGTDLLVQMKIERSRPRHLVSLARVAALRGIEAGPETVIGATATLYAVANHPVVRQRYGALAQACKAFSTVQVMVMGTIGGNLCNGSPAADSAPALLVFDAVAELRSPRGARQVELASFFVGPGRTVLAKDELLSAVRLPPVPTTSGSAFVKVARVVADISKVCAAVSVVRDGDRVGQCRIALGSVAPTPIRARRAEAAVTGQRLDASVISEMERLVAEEIAPITDQRSSAEYRRRVASVVVGDAVRSAWRQSGGGEME